MRDLVILLVAAGAVVGAGLYLNKKRTGADAAAPSPTARVSGSPDRIISTGGYFGGRYVDNLLDLQFEQGWGYGD